MTQPLRALIIDDSADDADLLTRDLRREGYELSSERTDTAAGLRAALDAQPWDIILCDYNMPRFSGLEALEIVRGRGWTCRSFSYRARWARMWRSRL